MANKRIRRKQENKRLDLALKRLDPEKVARDFAWLSITAKRLATVVE